MNFQNGFTYFVDPAWAKQKKNLLFFVCLFAQEGCIKPWPGPRGRHLEGLLKEKVQQASTQAGMIYIFSYLYRHKSGSCFPNLLKSAQSHLLLRKKMKINRQQKTQKPQKNGQNFYSHLGGYPIFGVQIIKCFFSLFCDKLNKFYGRFS